MDRYLRCKDVVDITRLSRSTIWRLEKAGKFPRRRKLTAGSVAWLAREVQEWMEDRPRAGS